MNIDDLIRNIDNAIVLLNSEEYIELSLAQLEELYTHIEDILEEIPEDRRYLLLEKIRSLNDSIDKVKENILQKLQDKEKEKHILEASLKSLGEFYYCES